MGPYLMYLSLALVLLWTARLARSKGYKPWLWAGASLALMSLGLVGLPNAQLLGMAPLGVLLFLKNRRVRAEVPEQEYVECPRCQARHSLGHNFCVECGWKLETLEDRYAEDAASVEPRSPAPEVTQPTASAPNPAETMAGAAEPIAASDEPQPGREEATVTAAASMENEAPPEPEPPPQRPAVIRPLSAENLTERGVSLLDQGRIQEAIDQFTKAIALNAGYRPAWSRRAEAYDKIGRNQEAAEDLRRLEAI